MRYARDKDLLHNGSFHEAIGPIGLLWKEEVIQLPESYEVARHRLTCLQKKFKKDPQLQQTMQAEIDKLICKGYARKVSENEMSSNAGRIWYLPIFVALNPNKPGFVSHYTIGLKMLLQDIWRSGIKWDDELNEDLFPKRSSWLFNLTKISSIIIPRCYSRLLKATKNVQLHTFVDAGENAYAAVCYFRIQYNDDIDVRIIAAKTKVTPLKPISIPRLELQAALIGSRLASKIRNATRLNCEECFYWSDSKTVLKCLSMDPKNFKAFVMYRVGEILEFTNVTQWSWVPSKLNPADYATKICAPDEDM
ncbi:hypothetical protein CVS40_9674 [Lucilia cuprina]|nr:hypothetical protein CVS40_9674 [Lucilia cuprina]